MLWQKLRRKQLGYKFRRQYGVGKYVVDFYCQKKRLAIELDGATHSTNAEQKHDAERQNYIENLNIKIIRFNNSDIYKNMNEVINKINKNLKKTNLFIISGPSGAGEDSIIAGLKKEFPIEKIVTTTTREIRPNEIDGQDYYFISKKEFERDIKENKFFEWAEEDNGQLYGGTFKELRRVQALEDKIGIWKIDYKGALKAKEIFPNVKSIFIYIPMNIIEKRLRSRGSHSDEFIAARLEYSKGWFANRDIFDFEVENKEGKLEETIQKVKNIILNNT